MRNIVPKPQVLTNSSILAAARCERLIGDNLVEAVQGVGARVTASARHLRNTAPGKAAQPHDPDHGPQLAATVIDLRSGLPYVSGERRSLLALPAFAATMPLAMPIERWSLRLSEEMSDDEAADVVGPAWVGVIQLEQTVTGVQQAPDLAAGVEVPSSVSQFVRNPKGLG